MNLIYQIYSYGILVSYTPVLTSQGMIKNFGAPSPSCFVYKQVNAQPREY
jgi:hypothetical protein